jgi:hypothetical protein
MRSVLGLVACFGAASSNSVRRTSVADVEGILLLFPDQWRCVMTAYEPPLLRARIEYDNYVLKAAFVALI